MSTPEVITINSEALEAQIRDLLPSQSGFGSELQASNVITPIIDLTAAAEGSGLDVSLQQSIAHGSITSYKVSNATSTIISATGFYRIFGNVSSESSTSASRTGDISITDGSTSKKIQDFDFAATNTESTSFNFYDFIVFLTSGDSVTVTTNGAKITISGCTRQIATVTGELVNPSGFVAE
jgi:hypothetical protein